MFDFYLINYSIFYHLQKKPTKIMMSMPPEEVEKLQKTDTEELDIEYNELEPFYDKVIKRLEVSDAVQ